MNKRLGFHTHLTNLFNPGSKILHIFIPKRRLTSFYFLIIWWLPNGVDFHISKLNSQIKKLHERVWIVYQYCTPSFTKLHENYSSRTIHNKIILLPAIELPKTKNELLSPFNMWGFHEKHNILKLAKKNWMKTVTEKQRKAIWRH